MFLKNGVSVQNSGLQFLAETKVSLQLVGSITMLLYLVTSWFQTWGKIGSPHIFLPLDCIFQVENGHPNLWQPTLILRL